MAERGKIGLVYIPGASGPSPTSPFFRRFFGNDAKREEKETRALYEELASQPNPFPLEGLGQAVYDQFYEYLSEDIREPFIVALNEVIAAERYMFECPPPPNAMTLAEFADYRTFLRKRQYFLAHHQSIGELCYDGLVRIFAGIAERLPRAEAPSPFTIPLVYALPEPKVMVDKVYGTLVENKYAERGLFSTISTRMYELLCKQSGRIPNHESKKPFKNAEDSDGTLDEICERYLKGTPFFDLFMAPIPLKFTHHERFEHMHVIGGTGAGKTSLLETLILNDLAFGETPGLIVIDSQGDLIQKLAHLAVFDGKHSNRLIYVTPKDIDYPPALNVFDVKRDRLGTYNEAVKEQVIAGVIQTFDYLFAGLLGADLTAKQGIFFKYVARLMLALPETMGRNATILDMLKLMQDPAPYAMAIQSL
ncbi:MAG: type IV secretion system DNA-binding domain-containing protein, partial [Alphaproteobacteria bacterium]|uniref:type IV secretion system DNA-binding domain-containing protein n=1 Tax=Bradyrhizobium sp. TaxID=376 RepID=UPI001ECDB3B3